MTALERIVEVEGRELRMTRGLYRVEGRQPGWQYNWDANTKGCSQFLSDSTNGGPIEGFRKAISLTIEHPYVAGRHKRKENPVIEELAKPRRGPLPGAIQVRWTKAEWRRLAMETFRQMQLGAGDFRACAENAQDDLIKSGVWNESRRRAAKFLNKSMAPILVKYVDELREVAVLNAAQQPVEPDPEPTPPEEPEEVPQEEPLPAAAAAAAPQPMSWGTEEQKTVPRPAEVIGAWIGATLSSALSRPEVQEAISTCFFAAFQRVIPALSQLAAQLIPAPPPAPEPEPTAFDPAAWVRAHAKPTPEPEPVNGAKTAMELALKEAGVDQLDIDPPAPKHRVYVVGLHAEDIARFEKDYDKKLDIEFAHENTSKDQIRAKCKTRDYCFSTMHPGSAIDAILKANMPQEAKFFRCPDNKKLVREKLDMLVSGMQV